MRASGQGQRARDGEGEAAEQAGELGQPGYAGCAAAPEDAAEGVTTAKDKRLSQRHGR